MKRQIKNEGIDSIGREVCLNMVSEAQHMNPQKSCSGEEAFECKTCNRKFASFQALGRHRASHKKHRVEEGKEPAKLHNCSICGQGFYMGQALGGHMRKHRNANSEGFSSMDHVIEQVPVLKRSNTCSRINMWFDLNLTPLENDRSDAVVRGHKRT